MPLIPDQDLSLALLPEPDDEAAIGRFAATFDGYAHFGSLHASAEAAHARRRETLSDLRNELFFAWRASRHGAGDEFVATYAELLPLFRKRLAGE